MSNGDEPWSPYHLSHQLGNHNTVLDDIKDLFQELENLNLSDGQNSSPTLCYPDNQFLLDSNSSDDSEESEEISEVAALDNLLGLAVTLAESYIDYGRFAPQTLWQEFSLAKAVEANGNHKEAEYHCRRILSQCSQASVESFLGMILANASRLEESMLCFSHALTCFIIRFGNYSVPQNAVVFSPIESLLTELILRSEQDLTPLTSCVCQMLGAIRRAISEGTILQISPDLFIYGLSFAHQCSVLGFTDSAKCMFRDLLKYSTLHLNVILHAKEKATAHQRYGLLLRKERNWTASAEQLLLACDSARNSGPHAIRLKILLERDYVELLPLLAFGPNEEDSIAERIRERLDLIQDPTFSLIQNNLEAAQASPINEFLQSALPIPLATLERSATSHTAQFGLCSAPTESAQRTGAPTSTESLSTGVSNPYGLTFSNGSGNSYVSNSVYMAA
jgi:tetratricopeptide (TPR) repeat protein